MDSTLIPASRSDSCGFFIRHHEMACGSSNDSTMEIRSRENFASALDCLADLRERRIPSLLREATGLHRERDMERLLDSCSYPVAFVAEELLGMIEDCFTTGTCSPEDLRKMREVYNALSSFHEGPSRRISSWGHLSSSVSCPGPVFSGSRFTGVEALAV